MVSVKVEAMSSEIAQPERPIQSLAEDRLERAPFVDGLVDALVHKSSGRSSGIVLGITGAWGSGKSSILNMLEEKVVGRYPGAHVVRFDPWLVSGRNDLITEFLRELLSTFKPDDQKHKALTQALAKYGSLLAPIANLTLPGGGAAIAGGLNAIGELLSKGDSISGLRKTLFAQLKEIDAPIVVLIDELDRVEDSEIRTVAQLVRSVADFPGISYVIAYDAHRVIQALGNDADGATRSERGRAYLEKIVQFSFPLPALLAADLDALLAAELRALATGLNLPANFENSKRYKRTAGFLLENGLTTPRDIKRLIGAFHVLAGIVSDEVDWMDLLVLCLLSGKAPRTLEKVRADPDSFVSNPLSRASTFRLTLPPQRKSQEDELRSLVAPDEYNEAVRNLMMYLFPRFAPQGRTIDYSDALALRRPLLTALRFGLVPGGVSREAASELTKSTRSKVVDHLQERFESDTLPVLLDRIREIYSELDANHEEFWIGVTDFLRPDFKSGRSLIYMRGISEAFGDVVERSVEHKSSFKAVAANIMDTLAAAGDRAIVPELLRRQFFYNGIYGSAQQKGTAILNQAETTEFVNKVIPEWRRAHLAGDLLKTLYDLDAVYAIQQAGQWDASCLEQFTRELDEPALFEAVVVMMFGGNRMTSTRTIAQVCDHTKFESLVLRRLFNQSFDGSQPGLQNALTKFKDRPKA